jgi:hypothetical protein
MVSSKRILATLLPFALLLLSPVRATAVIDGDADGSAHPYVGAVDGRPVGGPVKFGSGVLISPTVLLTAGHGTAHFDAAGLTRARVSFDPVITDDSTWYWGTVHTNPAYDPRKPNSDNGDLGVIVFDEPVPGVAPATLPGLRALDRLTAGSARPRFEIAGYGVTAYTGGPDGGGKRRLDYSSAGTRTLAQERFAGLSDGWLRLSAVGDDEICTGDSGSPAILAGTDMVAGITDLEPSLDGGECESGTREQRIDTAASRAFIGQYVPLP